MRPDKNDLILNFTMKKLVVLLLYKVSVKCNAHCISVVTIRFQLLQKNHNWVFREQDLKAFDILNFGYDAELWDFILL